MAKENEEAMRRIMNCFKIIATILLCLNVFWFDYDIFKQLSNEYVDGVLIMFNKTLYLFASPYITIVAALVFFSLASFGEKGRKSETIKLLNKWEFKPSKKLGLRVAFIALILVLISPLMLYLIDNPIPRLVIYTLWMSASFLGYIFGCAIYTRTIMDQLDYEDYFNNYQESAFPQNEKLIETEDSVNIPTKYRFLGQTREGWINVINPFRGTMVLGTPGSGKSFAIINPFIRQQLKKGYTMYCYDFKFPTLSEIVYNNLRWNKASYMEKYGKMPRFCVINFDDPRHSHRANPIKASSLNDVTDANEIAKIVMYNLNRTWINKQGDFFVESAINFLTAAIWYLKCTQNGKYCTFPHVIEFVNQPMENTIPLMASCEDLTNYMAPFFNAWAEKAVEQIQGQVASVQIPLSRLTSKLLYWTMSGDDFNMDINNPEDPKVLCVGNNPLKVDIYGTALSLFNGRIVRLINQQKKLKCSLIIDELPTIFMMGIDQLIATARSNKVAVLLGFQDFSQLVADYKKESADKIIKTIGNVFSGQVNDETAKSLSARFGKNKQHKRSISINENGVSTSISEQNDVMIPESKISQLSQGWFVGSAADDFGKENDKKAFHCQIQVDLEEVKAENEHMKPMPTIYSFDDGIVMDHLKNLCEKLSKQHKSMKDCRDITNVTELIESMKKHANQIGGEKGNQIKESIEEIRDRRMEEILQQNQRKIASDIEMLVEDELNRIEELALTNPRLRKIAERRRSAMSD